MTGSGQIMIQTYWTEFALKTDRSIMDRNLNLTIQSSTVSINMYDYACRTIFYFLFSHLCFCDAQQFGHVRPFRRRQVLFQLKLPLQLEYLSAGERGPRLLPLPVTASVRRVTTVTLAGLLSGRRAGR